MSNPYGNPGYVVSVFEFDSLSFQDIDKLPAQLALFSSKRCNSLGSLARSIFSMISAYFLAAWYKFSFIKHSSLSNLIGFRWNGTAKNKALILITQSNSSERLEDEMYRPRFPVALALAKTALDESLSPAPATPSRNFNAHNKLAFPAWRSWADTT